MTPLIFFLQIDPVSLLQQFIATANLRDFWVVRVVFDELFQERYRFGAVAFFIEGAGG